LADFPLGPGVTAEQREQIKDLIVGALNTLDGELAGKFYPLGELTD
jgi:hypothetical protein